MPPPYLMPYQILAAQVESSCAVNVISLSGSTTGRRNIFANSRTKGAPVTVFGSMVTTCICVEICGGGWGLLRAEDALVFGRLPATGASSHFSICAIDCAGFTEMIMTVFTAPPAVCDSPGPRAFGPWAGQAGF